MHKSIQSLSFLGPQLLEEIALCSSIQNVPKGTEIMRQKQYVKTLPIVLSGLIKIFSKYENRELLLYYIQPAQSCVMSFAACLKNQPSKVFAMTEEDSEILLIPVDKIANWIREYPVFNNLFYEQYDIRYTELLDTIQSILIDKMDKRL